MLKSGVTNQVLGALRLSRRTWCCERCRAAALKADNGVGAFAGRGRQAIIPQPPKPVTQPMPANKEWLTRPSCAILLPTMTWTMH
jgi:hypothetical protein